MAEVGKRLFLLKRACFVRIDKDICIARQTMYRHQIKLKTSLLFLRTHFGLILEIKTEFQKNSVFFPFQKNVNGEIKRY